MKNTALLALKVLVPLAIIVYLVYSITNDSSGDFQQLLMRPKKWRFLVLATTCGFAAVCLSFVRWFLLVRALDIPFRLRDAFRLGFLGFLLSFVSLGAIGGDLFKAFFIAHEQPGRRGEAVATIVVDRIVGLFGLLLLAALALTLLGTTHQHPIIGSLCLLSWLCLAAGLGLLVMLLVLPLDRIRGIRWLRRFPSLRHLVDRAASALACYRDRKRLIALAAAIGLGVHILLALSIHWSATGLLEQSPTLAEHLVIWPSVGVAGAVPLAPAGLGQAEVAMRELYHFVPANRNITANDGLLVALFYRLQTILVAIVGVLFYWTARREVKEVLHEVEEGEETGAQVY